MDEWKDINLPKESELVTGFFNIDGCIQFKTSCFQEEGQFYCFDFDGETRKCPIPSFWKKDEDLPSISEE